MTIVGGFDLHREQITFDYVDDNGLVRWGRIRPATRRTLRRWLAERCPDGDGEFALEGCTGWRYVSEELAAAGMGVHLGDSGRDALARVELSAAGHHYVDAALRRIDELTREIVPLRAQLVGLAHRQAGCRALLASQYGVGWLSAAIMWAEIGDARRFRNSGQLVRFAGLDITVYSSADHRAAGHLSRQDSPELRWAAFEAAKCAARPASPDYAYYRQVAARKDGKRPTLAVERKVLRRCYHTLRELGDAALAEPDPIGQAA